MCKLCKKYDSNKKTQPQLKYRDTISAYIGIEPTFTDVYFQYPNTRRVKYSIEQCEDGVEQLRRINEIYKMSEDEFQSKFGFSKKMIKFPGNGFCKFEKDDYTDRNEVVFGRSSRKVNGEYTMNKKCNTNISMWFEASVLQPLKLSSTITFDKFTYYNATKWKADISKYINKYTAVTLELNEEEAWIKFTNYNKERSIDNIKSNVGENYRRLDLYINDFKHLLNDSHKALDLYINNNVRIILSGVDVIDSDMEQMLWDIGVTKYSHRYIVGVKDCVGFISHRDGIRITLVELNDAILESKFHGFRNDEIDSAILGWKSVDRIKEFIEIQQQMIKINSEKYSSSTSI